ncbi:toxin biosynthesis protein [Coprinopsis cinerea AmutBmut pab1-1]|nr:toxin biosynthesis protein [Coprinopsis cinerea AmutBmut pab1-1]
MTLLLGAEVFNLLGTASRPSPYRRLFFLPILFLSIWPLFSPISDAERPGQPFVGLLYSLLFSASDKILFTDIQNELYLRSDKALTDAGKVKHVSQRSVWGRVKWAVELRLALRGVGWSFEPSPGHLPPPAPQRGRWTFVLCQLLRAVYHVLFLDLCSAVCRLVPYFSDFRGLMTGGFPGRLSTWLFIVASHHVLSMPFCVISAIGVAVGWGEPREWPQVMGNPLDAYTVRRAWGRVWHQALRRTLTSNADFVAYKILRLPKKGVVSRYTRLFGAFFFSGVLHYFIDCVAMGHRGSLAIRTFVLQACAITFEDAVVEVAKRCGTPIRPNWFTRGVGIVWVVVWFAWSAAPWFSCTEDVKNVVQDGMDLGVGTRVVQFVMSRL